MPEIKIVPAYPFPRETAGLFEEYTNGLIEGEAGFKEYLKMQNYTDELAHLESKYGPPDGRLYLAYCDNEPAGCVGLKRLGEESCEMKRLYVRPKFREKRIGSALVQRIISDAREIGYRHMLLDTLPFLQSAIQLYRKLGFYEIESYNDNPIASSVYMKLDL